MTRICTFLLMIMSSLAVHSGFCRPSYHNGIPVSLVGEYFVYELGDNNCIIACHIDEGYRVIVSNPDIGIYEMTDIESSEILDWAFNVLPSELEKANYLYDDSGQIFSLFYSLWFVTDSTETVVDSAAKHVETPEYLQKKVDLLKGLLMERWVKAVSGMWM